MVYKMKVTLRHQTFQFQRHLHASAMENLLPSVVVLFYVLSLNSWWFVVFSAVSRVSSFEAGNDTDNLVSARREKQQLYASLHHIDAVRS